MDCQFCNCAPAEHLHVPTSLGSVFDLCSDCLRSMAVAESVVNATSQTKRVAPTAAHSPKLKPSVKGFTHDLKCTKTNRQ